MILGLLNLAVDHCLRGKKFAKLDVFVSSIEVVDENLAVSFMISS
jgi:hypothetical protein